MSRMTIEPASSDETAELIREHLVELRAELEIAETPEEKVETEKRIAKWEDRLGV